MVAHIKNTLGLDIYWSASVSTTITYDNIHSPNEKYDLRSFQKGIRSGPHSRRTCGIAAGMRLEGGRRRSRCAHPLPGG